MLHPMRSVWACVLLLTLIALFASQVQGQQRQANTTSTANAPANNGTAHNGTMATNGTTSGNGTMTGDTTASTNATSTMTTTAATFPLAVLPTAGAVLGTAQAPFPAGNGGSNRGATGPDDNFIAAASRLFPASFSSLSVFFTAAIVVLGAAVML